MSVAALLSDVLGDDVPVAFRAYDGSSFGPSDARTTIVVRSPDALRRIVTAPDELGFGRAYVAGELEVDGDIFDVMAVANYIEELRLGPRQIAAAAKLVGVDGPEAAAAAARGGAAPRPPPLADARRRRDRAPLRRVERLLPDGARAVAHLLVRGVARRHHHARGRAGEQARAHLPQARRSNRACASSTSGAVGAACCCTPPSTTACEAVGVTLSRPQAELARKRVAERGLGDRVEVRFADFRDVDDGPYDAISSIGMFEHVGLSELDAYFRALPRAAAARRPAAQPRHQPSAPRRQDAPPPLGAVAAWVAASPSATCSPTASCTRSATSSPRSSAPGSRPATWRACASTTRCTLRCWVAQPRGATGTTRSREVGAGRARVLAPLHGGGRGRVRARRQPGAPGARDRHHRRRQRDAPPARIHLTHRAR